MQIGTHNGFFHADEVLACTMLKYLYPESTIIRTRKRDILQHLDLIVDVFGEYNPSKLRFDHHQKCNETFSEFSQIPLSSAGMIFKHFGKQIIQKFITNHKQEIKNNETLVDKIYESVYFNFIQAIDAIDNGITQYKYAPTPKFHDFSGFSYTIKHLNSNEESNDELQMQQFHKAMKIANSIFFVHLNQSVNKCNALVEEYPSFKKCFETRFHPNILVFDRYYKTWGKQLRLFDPNNEIKFTIYPKNEEQSIWGFSTIQVPNEQFTNFIDLLSEPRMRDLLTNKNDLIFVHKNLFCGSASTLETAKEACLLSIEHQPIYNYFPFGHYIRWIFHTIF